MILRAYTEDALQLIKHWYRDIATVQIVWTGRREISWNNVLRHVKASSNELFYRLNPTGEYSEAVVVLSEKLKYYLSRDPRVGVQETRVLRQFTRRGPNFDRGSSSSQSLELYPLLSFLFFPLLPLLSLSLFSIQSDMPGVTLVNVSPGISG